MDYINVTVLSDDGEYSVSASIVSRHIVTIAEVHDTMIENGDVPTGTNSIILIRDQDDPLPVKEDLASLRAQL